MSLGAPFANGTTIHSPAFGSEATPVGMAQFTMNRPSRDYAEALPMRRAMSRGRSATVAATTSSPSPEVASLTEPNAMVDQWDLDDEGRRLRSRTETVGEYFAQEQPLLRPLPREVFETGCRFAPRVDPSR
ncbi:hypothetical protein [Streptomyces mexicanus]|uniref:hypothetical protein n=1 Tax=Streptomyces mexicanus TaxID=178566 RepID=UPI00365CDA8E